MRKYGYGLLMALIVMAFVPVRSGRAAGSDHFSLSSVVFDSAWVAAGSVTIANQYYVPTTGQYYTIDMGMYEYGAGQSYTGGNPPVTGSTNQTLTYSSANGLVTDSSFVRYYNGTGQTGAWSATSYWTAHLTSFYTTSGICSIPHVGISYQGSFWIPHYNGYTVGSRYVAAFNPSTGYFDFSQTAMATWDSDGDGFSDYQELEYVWSNGLGSGTDGVYNQRTILENPHTPAATRIAETAGYYWYYDAGTNSILRWNGITLDRVQYTGAPASVRAYVNANLSALTTDFTAFVTKAGNLQNTATLTGGLILLQDGLTSSTLQNDGTIFLAATSEGYGWISGGNAGTPQVSPRAESQRSFDDSVGLISITGASAILSNTGVILGDSSSRIELTSTDGVASLTNRNSIAAGTISFSGESAALVNAGTLQADMEMNSTTTNTLSNESGGIFVGGVNMSATTANVLANEAGGVFFASAINLSADVSNALQNAGTLQSSSVSLHCDTAAYTNTGTTIAGEIVLDADITNLFEATAGSTTAADKLLFQPTATVAGENNLIITDVGRTRGSFNAGVQFLNPDSTNHIALTNSDVTFATSALGWGNNASDSFTATNSIIRAPNGLLLGGATGGATFQPDQTAIIGDVTMQNITVSGAPSAANFSLLTVAGGLYLDGTNFYLTDVSAVRSLLTRYGDTLAFVTADNLTVGGGGVFAETVTTPAVRIDNSVVLFSEVTPLYESMQYVWAVVPGTNGLVGVRLVFKDGWFEPYDDTGGDFGHILDEIVQNPGTFPDGLHDLFDSLAGVPASQLSQVLDQLNGQRNLLAAELAMSAHALSSLHGAFGSRFDAWRDQRRLERGGFALCSSRRYRIETSSAAVDKTVNNAPGKAKYTNITDSSGGCDGCDEGQVLSNVETAVINVRRFVLEPFGELYANNATQEPYGRAMSGYDSTLYGGIAGINFSFSADWNIGGFLDMARGAATPADYGHIDDTLIRIGGYSSWNWDEFYWDSVLSAGTHLLESCKNLQYWETSASSKYTGYEAAWYNAIGYRFELPADISLTPYHSFMLSCYHTDERAETGAALGANMQHNAVTSFAMQDNLGFKLSRIFKPRPCMAIVPRLFVDYEFGANSVTQVNSAFVAAPEYEWTTPVEFASTSRANIGIGINTYFGNRFSIDGNLYAKLWNGGALYGGNIGLGIKF